jgi:hypothetical protein
MFAFLSKTPIHKAAEEGNLSGLRQAVQVWARAVDTCRQSALLNTRFVHYRASLSNNTIAMSAALSCCWVVHAGMRSHHRRACPRACPLHKHTGCHNSQNLLKSGQRHDVSDLLPCLPKFDLPTCRRRSTLMPKSPNSGAQPYILRLRGVMTPLCESFCGARRRSM